MVLTTFDSIPVEVTLFCTDSSGSYPCALLETGCFMLCRWGSQKSTNKLNNFLLSLTISSVQQNGPSLAESHTTKHSFSF